MAYISKEEVQAIRTELKTQFPKWRFGVKKGSGSLSVQVSILKGTEAFDTALRNGHAQVNQYWINDHFKDAGEAKVLHKIIDIMKTAPAKASGRAWFDESDAMTDYFHTAYYMDLSIGAWNKPYECVEG